MTAFWHYVLLGAISVGIAIVLMAYVWGLTVLCLHIKRVWFTVLVITVSLAIFIFGLAGILNTFIK